MQFFQVLSVWHDEVQFRKRTNAILGVCVAHMQKRQESAVLQMWREIAQNRRRLRRIANTSVNLLQGRTMAITFAQWREWAASAKLRLKVGDFVTVVKKRCSSPTPSWSNKLTCKTTRASALSSW
jgi:hypothetical protein